MKELLRKNFSFPLRPEKILQFGEGNFLRCFIDWQIDIINEKTDLDDGIVIVRPIVNPFQPSLNTQDGLYTTIIRGYNDKAELCNEKRLITSVTRELSAYRDWEAVLETAHNPDMRFIFSNTTEAGIAFSKADTFEQTPPSTYPAKLTRYLFERFKAFSGDSSKGFIILPCELIDYNGEKLKEFVLDYAKLWKLEEAFTQWLLQANIFCSTLVDRIVTGFPGNEIESLWKELNYKDNFITTGEYFHLFVIQGPQCVAEELKIRDSGLQIQIVEDLKPFKVRKVGILNGCHTALVPVAFLCGLNYVRESIEDKEVGRFADLLIQQEIIPHLGLPIEYAKEFADSVLGRFKNPFINHQLISISLNSMTKFRTRVLPQFITYYKEKHTLPPLMSLSLAALICFYRGVRVVDGSRESFETKDDKEFLDVYSQLWATAPASEYEAVSLVKSVLSLQNHWETDLLSIVGLKETIGHYVWRILQEGMRSLLKELL